MCPFSKERGQKAGHSQAPKGSRFPGCPLRGCQPSRSYPQATDNLYRANGRGRSGGQTAGGDSSAFPQLKEPLFAVPALRELKFKVLAGLVFCEMLSQYAQSAFQGSPRVHGRVSSSLRPKPSASICSVLRS